jgi:hypothetical protein
MMLLQFSDMDGVGRGVIIALGLGTYPRVVTNVFARLSHMDVEVDCASSATHDSRFGPELVPTRSTLLISKVMD